MGKRYTEGVMFDGAVILNDGMLMPLDEVLDALNNANQAGIALQQAHGTKDPETRDAYVAVARALLAGEDDD